jgi:hypothetical protein
MRRFYLNTVVRCSVPFASVGHSVGYGQGVGWAWLKIGVLCGIRHRGHVELQEREDIYPFVRLQSEEVFLSYGGPRATIPVGMMPQLLTGGVKHPDLVRRPGKMSTAVKPTADDEGLIAMVRKPDLQADLALERNRLRWRLNREFQRPLRVDRRRVYSRVGTAATGQEHGKANKSGWLPHGVIPHGPTCG